MSFDPPFASPQLPANRRLAPHSRHIVQQSGPPSSSNGARALRPLPSDTSISSTTSALTLASLTQQDIQLLDAIINRAPPSATSFLSVFKAYNDVLQERGIDAAQDVTYYRFLLKLGVVRGNWGERWQMVKNGRAGGYARGSRLAGGNGEADDDYDHSHDEITTEADTTGGTITADESTDCGGQETPKPNQNQRLFITQRPITTPSAPLLLERKTPTSTTHILPLRANSQLNPIPRLSSLLPPKSQPQSSSRLRHQVQPTAGAASEAEAGSSSTPSRPPSYRTYAQPTPANRGPKTPSARPPQPGPTSGRTTAVTNNNNQMVPALPPPRTLAEFAEAAAKSGKLKHTKSPNSGGPSAINADETWKILRMEREADDFRTFMLVRRAWDKWFRAVERLQTRNSRIDAARTDVIVRHTFNKWRMFYLHRAALVERADNVASILIRRACLKQWKVAFYEKKRKAWQDEMRKRMGDVRRRVDGRILAAAFLEWYRKHQDAKSTRFDAKRIVSLTFRHWKKRFERIDQLAIVAEQVVDTRDRMNMERSVAVWRGKRRLQETERVFRGRQNRKTLKTALRSWRDTVQLRQMADSQRNGWAAKHALIKWIQSKHRVEALERRAVRHVNHQESILVHAVTRVWVAKERGALLNRVRTTRLLKEALSSWRIKLEGVRKLEGWLLVQSSSKSRLLAQLALRVWRQKQRASQRAVEVAENRYEQSVMSRTLLSWRVQMAMNAKGARNAKIARQFFMRRSVWSTWRDALEARRREKKVLVLQKRVARRVIQTWHDAARRQKNERLLVLAFRDNVSQRIVLQCVRHWVAKTIELKSVQLEVGVERDTNLVKGALEKWHAVLARRKEEMNLMQSYHDVKRDDLVRRTFLRWLAVTRMSLHRQRRLEQKKDQQRKAELARAWETWREKYKERELGWAERRITTQTHLNVLFRAFRIWESKTMSVPAVRFHSLNVKAKMWNKWRNAMPRARTIREARELDSKWVLSKSLARWKDAYRTKIQLKAIARARHLRLPVVPSARPTYQRPSVGGIGAALASRPSPFSSPAGATSTMARVAARMAASPERSASIATPEPRIDYMAANPQIRDSPESSSERSVSPVRARTSLLTPGAGTSTPFARLGGIARTKTKSIVSSKSVPAATIDPIGGSPPKRRAFLTTSPSKHRRGESLFESKTTSQSVADTESVASTTRHVRRSSVERGAIYSTSRSVLGSTYHTSPVGAGGSGTPASERDKLRMELRLARKKDPL
ncbi:hypothetical protein FRB93_007345 [Tulasnella sp. JGI-2019a]|nr:hypothetical protein FRB93_007345 [Tulasnella sp. JGI-2019a]